MKIKCEFCGAEGFNGYKGYFIDDEIKYFCKDHASQAPVQKGRRSIYDATGKVRDRDWLNNKLEMTRTEKRWHEDIKSRRIMPDGTVRRIKR